MHTFGRETNNIYDVNNIHDNDINNIDGCNVLHGMINPS